MSLLSNIRGICIYAAIALLSANVWAEENLTNDVNDIAGKIAISEKRVNNLFVKGETTTEIATPTAIQSEIPDSLAQWTTTPQIASASLWMNCAMDGPFRIDIEKEITQWLGVPKGKPSFGQESRRVIFDGKKLTVFKMDQGFMNETQKAPRAEISSNESLERNTMTLRCSSGLLFTPYQWNLSDKLTLSAYIKSYLGWQDKNKEKYKPIIKIVHSDKLEKSPVKLTMGYVDTMEESWTFDPSKEWLLIEYERRAGHQRILTDYFKVTKSEQIAKDIWYPSEAYYVDTERYLEKESIPTKHTYRAKSIRVNDPAIDDEIRSTTLPAGIPVTDNINKKLFMTSPPDDELSKQIDNTLQDAMKAATKPTTQNSVPK